MKSPLQLTKNVAIDYARFKFYHWNGLGNVLTINFSDHTTIKMPLEEGRKAIKAIEAEKQK